MITVEDLKKKPTISREDIGELLKSFGKPGERQEEKLKALADLNRQNRQGHSLEATAESYPEF